MLHPQRRCVGIDHGKAKGLDGVGQEAETVVGA
jgi:hypothetical protein